MFPIVASEIDPLPIVACKICPPLPIVACKIRLLSCIGNCKAVLPNRKCKHINKQRVFALRFYICLPTNALLRFLFNMDTELIVAKIKNKMSLVALILVSLAIALAKPVRRTRHYFAFDSRLFIWLLTLLCFCPSLQT